jgi:hypothetical protein
LRENHAFAGEASFGWSSIRFLVGAELGVPMTAILKVSIHVAYYLTMIVQIIVQHSSHIIATVLALPGALVSVCQEVMSKCTETSGKEGPAMSKKKIGDNIFTFDSPEMKMHASHSMTVGMKTSDVEKVEKSCHHCTLTCKSTYQKR